MASLARLVDLLLPYAGHLVVALALAWLLQKVRRLEHLLHVQEVACSSAPGKLMRLDDIELAATPVPTSADDVQYTILPGQPPRSVGSVLRSRVSVLDFGGKNDGATDCTDAIQQAINLAKTQNAVTGHGLEIFFPAGGYLVTKTLRVTDLAGGGVWFVGELNGITEWQGTGVGSCIVGRTGGVVFDCCGSQYLKFKSLMIQSDIKHADCSTCGLLFARTTASEFAQFNKIEDCVIDLASDPAANKGKGTVAVCMIAAEITTLSNVALLADTALANVIENYWSIESAFATIDTKYISNSCITLDGMCMLSAKDPVGCCWRGQNAVNVTMNNVYLQAFAVPPAPATGGKRAPGLVIEGGYKISVGGHSEGPTSRRRDCHSAAPPSPFSRFSIWIKNVVSSK